MLRTEICFRPSSSASCLEAATRIPLLRPFLGLNLDVERHAFSLENATFQHAEVILQLTSSMGGLGQ